MCLYRARGRAHLFHWVMNDVMVRGCSGLKTEKLSVTIKDSSGKVSTEHLTSEKYIHSIDSPIGGTIRICFRSDQQGDSKARVEVRFAGMSPL